MASGLIQIVQGQLAKEIQLIDKQLAKHGKYLNGRQIYWIICNHLKVCETQGAINELKDLLAFTLKVTITAYMQWFGQGGSNAAYL